MSTRKRFIVGRSWKGWSAPQALQECDTLVEAHAFLATQPAEEVARGDFYIDDMEHPDTEQDRTHLLLNYRVVLQEEKGNDLSELDFDCQAEDVAHASEQALNAYPEGDIQNIWLLVK